MTVADLFPAADRAAAAFADRFGASQAMLLIRAPGRINLIGEHTDYNEGFVLPGATTLSACIAVAPGRRGRIRLLAADLDEYREADAGPQTPCDRPWANYLLGVIEQLRLRGLEMSGADAALASDIPIGAGMASSAALCTGFAVGLDALLGFGLDASELVRIAHAAEHDFAGVRCGIMDQFSAIHGRAQALLHLDCRSLDYERVPFERSDVRLVLCDTRVRHQLGTGEYNLRRAQCEEAAAALRRHLPGVQSLRDVRAQDLDLARRELPFALFQRTRHVVEENARVLRACGALHDGDISLLGALLYQSHESLRDHFEVSCAELDSLVDIAARLDGVLGARMMGAGFGGSTITLVTADAAEAFCADAARLYQRQWGMTPGVMTVELGDGARLVTH